MELRISSRQHLTIAACITDTTAAAAVMHKEHKSRTCVFCATAASLSNTLSPAPGAKRLCSSKSMLLK
jgi:hypothetical protein